MTDTVLVIVALMVMIAGISFHFALPTKPYISPYIFGAFFLTITIERYVDGTLNGTNALIYLAGAAFFFYRGAELWRKCVNKTK